MTTVGTYIAERIEQLGIKDYFAIPGDYNLTLLDEVLTNDKLKMINCCNELNAGYAADGYARVKGVSALFVTYSVGGLSAINAVAGAFAENLPVLVFSGGPNTNSVQDAEILHHTLATEDYSYVRDMFARVCEHVVFIHKPEQAPEQIDHAIEVALKMKKPVYIEVACNIANAPVSAPTPRDLNIKRASDPTALKRAVEAVSEYINNAPKSVIVTGSGVRCHNMGPAVEALSEKTKIALAAMADAKGFVSEAHPNYIGVYWGPVSSPGCGEIVESSDVYLFVGPNFNDYTTTGHVSNISKKKLISVYDHYVKLGDTVYTGVQMTDFIPALTEKLKQNPRALESYKKIAGEAPAPDIKNLPANSKLDVRQVFAMIQNMLSPAYSVLAETGDSWFNAMRLRLPKNCPFEIQMQYGSIGWSVGATLGIQAAQETKKRVIACIGDGSFQMGAQEVSTMIRYGYSPIIFLMNNGAYTIEVEIHDGPYNEINNWKYAELVEVFRGHNKNAWGTTVRTAGELKKAIEKAEKTNALCFIEIMLDKTDCNKNLLAWGSRVAAYNARLPRQ